MISQVTKNLLLASLFIFISSATLFGQLRNQEFPSDPFGQEVMETVGTETGEATPQLFVPNAFTPNGDGINDLFGPVNAEASEDYSLNVYDRWGRQVFSSTSPQQQWDGRVGNKNLLSSVYLWTLSYRDDAGELQKEAGSVFLLR